MRRLSLLGLALLGALALSIPGAFAQADATRGAAADPGVTARGVTIGGTFPLTGPASTYAPIPRAMKAYFSYVNATRGPDGKRGVGGRQINFIFYDDGYNPAQTVQLTRRLVQQDRVFAVVGSLGTEHNEAIRPFLNSAKVPQVLNATGANTWGRDWKRYPYTTGWQPDYTGEGILFGRHIRANSASAKIGVIYQNDSYGKDYLYGLKVGLGSAKANIVSEQPYEVTSTDPRSQIARLRASGATIFVIFLTPRATIQSYVFARVLGWNPATIYTNSVSATDTFLTTAQSSGAGTLVNNTISVQYAKDPANPAWNNDAAIRLYRQIMGRYNPGARVEDGLNLYGVAVAHAFVQLLRKSGATPTRAGLMRAARSWNEANPFLLPGNRQQTGPKNQFPVRGERMVRFNNGRFTYISPLQYPR
jgi:branched-chain amino acid transport system substrate-binding protein